MESLEEGPKSKSFIKYVFSFDEDGKSEFINVIQYSLLAIIPMIILNKLMQKYVPDADEEKGSMEILAEVIIQVVIIFVSFIIINRIITFVPTYSGIKYPLPKNQIEYQNLPWEVDARREVVSNDYVNKFNSYLRSKVTKKIKL